ncbi:beta-propeller fold lactonase family protein [Mycobacterium lentiflavum]|uniref:YncE family protein n=1 Tax=Mycobacterium lentiflavum TaxID=141349 RepID=UPI001FD607B2
MTATIAVGRTPWGVAFSPDGTRAYVTNNESDSVSVSDTATNTVAATVYLVPNVYGVAVSPDGGTVYVANWANNTISMVTVEVLQ